MTTWPMICRVYEAWEKRDWGSGKRSWRQVEAVMKRYRRGAGPSQYAVRRVSNRAAKRREFFGSINLYGSAP